jgi:hypothetical protein
MADASSTFRSWHRIVRDGLRAEGDERNAATPPAPGGPLKAPEAPGNDQCIWEDMGAW